MQHAVASSNYGP